MIKSYTYQDSGNITWYDSNIELTKDEAFNSDLYYTHIVEEQKYYLRHREDGPALICPSGSEEWVYRGKLHRLYGPAVISVGWKNDVLIEDAGIYWYVYGKDMTKQANVWIEENNYPHWSEWDDLIRTHFKLTFL